MVSKNRDFVQQVALAIAPKVGGAISILGSLWIFIEIVGSREKKQLVYHRLMMMVSAFDILVSTGAFCSTWPMRTYETGSANNNLDPWKAAGNDRTCAVQGFAMQLGGTLFTYNAALSVFYVLLIHFRVYEAQLRRRYEWLLHGIPLVFGISTATIAAGMLENTRENLMAWITDPNAIKPGAQMPGADYEVTYEGSTFPPLNLNEEQIRALAAYLSSMR